MNPMTPDRSALVLVDYQQRLMPIVDGAARVVADACGSRSPADRALALQRLAQAGAVIASTEMVAFEWLDDCRHPRFGTVLGRIKQRATAR